MSETTTVKVSKETHEALTALGRKGETYDDIICRLMDFYNWGWDEHQEQFMEFQNVFSLEAEG